MLTYKDALKAAEEGQVMVGLSYLPHRQLVTVFDIRRTGEVLSMRFCKGSLYGEDHVQGEVAEDDEIIKMTRFKPLAGNVDITCMRPELAAYTFFMPALPHPYDSDRQGYKGHFAGSLACLV